MKRILAICLTGIVFLNGCDTKRVIENTSKVENVESGFITWIEEPALSSIDTNSSNSISLSVDMDAKIYWGLSKNEFFVFSPTFFENELASNPYFIDKGVIDVLKDELSLIDISSFNRDSDSFLYILAKKSEYFYTEKVSVVKIPQIIVLNPYISIFDSGVDRVINSQKHSIPLRVWLEDVQKIDETEVTVIINELPELTPIKLTYSENSSNFNGTLEIPSRLTAGTYTLTAEAKGPEINKSKELPLQIEHSDSFIEPFTDFKVSGTSYLSDSFIGTDGTVWHFGNCAGSSVGAIDTPTPYLAKGKTPAAFIRSEVIPGKLTKISFDYKQTHTTAVNLTISILDNQSNEIFREIVQNNNEKGVIKTIEFDIENQMIDGFIIQFEQTDKNSGQVAIDNIRWQM